MVDARCCARQQKLCSCEFGCDGKVLWLKACPDWVHLEEPIQASSPRSPGDSFGERLKKVMVRIDEPRKNDFPRKLNGHICRRPLVRLYADLCDSTGFYTYEATSQDSVILVAGVDGPAASQDGGPLTLTSIRGELLELARHRYFELLVR